MNKIAIKPRQQRKRQKIIDAAIKVFVQNGFQGTSMQSIAKRAEISTGSIYSYFKNKAALINEIYQLSLQKEHDYLLLDYNGALTIPERFEYLIRRSIQFKIEHQDDFHFRSHFVNTPSVRGGANMSEVFAGHPLAQVVVDGQAAGIFKPFDIEELFYFANAGASAVLRWRLYDKQAISAQEEQRIVDLVWDAISVEKMN